MRLRAVQAGPGTEARPTAPGAVEARGDRRWPLPQASLASIVILGALALSPPESARADARVTLTPASGVAGTNVSLRGRDYRRGQRLTVKLGRRLVVRTRTSNRGSFRASFTIPLGSGGAQRISSRSGPQRVVSTFKVLRLATAPRSGEVTTASGRRVRWTPLGTSVGGTVQVHGVRFPGGRRVKIRFAKRNVSGGRTSRGGRFTKRLTVPSLALGTYRARASAGRRALAFSLKVTPDPLIAAAGDIACDPESPFFNGGLGTATDCHMKQTSDVVLAANPAAVLVLGDIQYESGSFGDFQVSYHPTWGRFKSITHPVPGNHEYPGATSAPGYFAYFGAAAGPRDKGYYSFDIGAWHIIALNSNCPKAGVSCVAGLEQEQWLRRDLARHKNRCILAFWHHPLFGSGQEGSHPTMRDMFRALYDARADLVLNGHDHDYERFAPQTPDGAFDPVNGVRQFIVGTGGRDLQSFKKDIRPQSEVREATTYGVLALRLHPSSYEWEFLPEVGRTFHDAGSQTCH